MTEEKKPEKKEINEQDMQQRYMDLQMISQQSKQIEAQLGKIEEQLNELAVTTEALLDIQKADAGTEILAPISPGIFIKTKLSDNKEIIINVGSKVTVSKDIDDAIKLINAQYSEIEKYKREITETYSYMTLQMKEAEEALTKLIE